MRSILQIYWSCKIACRSSMNWKVEPWYWSHIGSYARTWELTWRLKISKIEAKVNTSSIVFHAVLLLYMYCIIHDYTQFGARSTIWSTSSYSRKFYNLGAWFFIELQTRDLRCEFINTTRNLHVYCSSTHISSMGTNILEFLYWPTCKRQSTTLS